MQIVHLKETESTNSSLRELIKTDDIADYSVVVADYQTAGRGQVGNTWVSEAGKNLLFSMIVRPNKLDVHKQFYLSMAVAVAIADAISLYCDDITIKWPNDIYHNDNKIAGILIENILRGSAITDSVIGAGINVNQVSFPDSLPNPTSIRLITGNEAASMELLNNIILRIPKSVNLILNDRTDDLKDMYMNRLYRYDDQLHSFSDSNDSFMARITDIKPDGRLQLTDANGSTKSYMFKEVEYVI